MIPLLLISILLLGSTAVAMSLRNLIHSALLLIVGWFATAAFYLWAGAEFVAFGQVLVYVGAVSMIVFFAVLLTRRSRAELALTPDSLARGAAGILAGGAAFSVLAFAIVRTVSSSPMPDTPAPVLTVKQIGRLLMGQHAAALLIVGVLLTVALLGAVVLAANEKRQ